MFFQGADLETIIGVSRQPPDVKDIQEKTATIMNKVRLIMVKVIVYFWNSH
jgi:hypothetical protein